jgi:VIT1/CCC1 family predicted Fe2+/Mn2+ transporter
MSDATAFREHWSDEQDGAALYRALAERSEGEQREIFLELAAAEERHARHWAAKLAELGEPEPRAEDHRLGARTRLLIWLTRRFGARAMLPIVERAEVSDAAHYDDVPTAKPSMAVDERIHARVVAGLSPASARSGIVRGERWHRGDASGALRAAIFGVNDGLVSNLALVMGVAGGQASASMILLAGLAGLLAGAFSMGAGEYISVRSQRELFEREIALEAEEIAVMPEEETNELALIYRAKGIPREEAEALAAAIMADPQHALDTKAREELGLNPEETRLTLGRRGLELRRLRDRRDHPGAAVHPRGGDGGLRRLDRGRRRRPVRGGRRRRAHHRALDDPRRAPPAADRLARGRGDVHDRADHRRLGELTRSHRPAAGRLSP